MSSFKCTCLDTECPYHPNNHDKGCDPCITVNIKDKEIPSCFMIEMGIDPTKVEDFSIENFAKMVVDKKGK